METVKSLTNFFEEILKDLNCHQNTKSYIIGIYNKYRISDLDFSKKSITLLFAQARNEHNFSIYQNLGDWLFYVGTIIPQYFNDVSPDYYHNIARVAYYTCYRLINKKWLLFEEMSDNYINLEKQAREKLKTLSF